MDNNCVIYIRKWNGEVERARCKHCSLRGAPPTEDSFSFPCKIHSRYVGPMYFACSDFVPRLSFSVVQNLYQPNLFNS